MSRIFISHSNRDNPRAIEVRGWLADNGWDDVFLDVDPTDGLAPGERWQNALKTAADRCEAVLFLISPNWLKSPWCLSEFLLAKQLGKRLFPVLIEGASMEGLPTEISSDHQAVDLVGDPQGWDRLKEGLRRAGLDANSFPFPAGRRPYPGFEPLTEEDAAIFFGREAQVLRGLDRLRLMRDAGAERMMVVLGASGAGKSSFVRAGLWPRLRRDDRNFLPLPTIRPERAVLSGKAGLFGALERTLSDPRLAGRSELAAFPRSRGALGGMVGQEGGLAELIGAIRRAATQSFRDGPPPTAVLLIDQAEELLNEEGQAESERFIELIAQTLDREKGLIVVLAIRSDAFPQFQAKPALASVAREAFDLPPMPEGSLRLVIEGPAKLASPQLKLEPALVDRLLADSTGQDALPLLAFTLDRLAREYGADGVLTLENYRAAGGVRGVVTSAVEEALADGRRRGLVTADPASLEKLLKQAFIPHLARVNEAGEFARRIAYSHELPALTKPLIELLVETRLLIRDRDGHGETIEVAHEALLREWPLLRGFLEADREFLISKRQIADDLNIWQDAPANKKSEALLSGLRLTRAQHFLSERSAQDLTDEERTFIGASIKAAEVARRRRNALVAGAIVLLTAFSALAATQWINARREAAVARLNKEEAQRSADKYRVAKDQSDANAKKAENNEALARGAQAKAQIQESISLADQSLRQSASGDIEGAMRRAIGALPADSTNLDRPFVAKADYALAKAFLANRLEATISPSSDWVNKVAYNSDGSRFAVGTRDGFLKIYDAATNRELTSSNARRQAVMTLAYSTDGSRLVAAYQDPPSLAVLDGASGKLIRTFRLSALPNAVLLSHDGSKAVVVSQQNEMRPAVVDLNDESGNIHFLESHPKLGGGFLSLPRATAMSPDDRFLLYVENNAVFVWDVASGALTATSFEAGSNIRRIAVSESDESFDAAAFRGDGAAVLIGKHRIYVADVRTGAIKDSFSFADDWQFATSRGPLLTPDGGKVVFAVNKRTLSTYSLTDWHLIAKRDLPADISEVAISPDGDVVAAAGADLTVRAWRIDSADPIGIFAGHKDRVHGMAFSPDGTHMISYGDATARLWNLRPSQAMLDMLPPGLKARSTNPRTMMAIVEREAEEYGSRTRLWSIARNEFVGSKAVEAFLADGATPQTFSPSGKWVAIRNDYRSMDAQSTRDHVLEILNGLVREATPGATPIEIGDGELHVVAVMQTDTGKAARVMIATGNAMLSDAAFLDDDGSALGLSASNYDGDNPTSSAEVWDVGTGKKRLSISQKGSSPKLALVGGGGCAVFSTAPTYGSHLSSIWRMSTGEKIAEFGRAFAASASGDDENLPPYHDRVLLGDAEDKPVLLECQTGKEVGAVAGAAVGASRLLMSIDRRRMLVDGIGAPRTLWNLDRAEKLSVIPDMTFDGSIAEFSADDRRIVTRGRRNRRDTIEVFDGSSGELVKAFPEQEAGLGFYTGLKADRIAVQSDARTVQILRTESPSSPMRISLENALRRWRFVASDERFVTVDEGGKLSVWDTRTGDRTFELAGADKIEPLGGASPKGTLIPVLLAGGDAVLLSTTERKIVWRLPPGRKAVGLQLAPDEKSIVITEAERISLFATDSQDEVASVPIEANQESYLDYNESGDRVELYVRVSGGGIGSVHLIDVSQRKEIGRFDDVGMLAMASNAELVLATQKKLSFRNGRTGALERELELESPASQVGIDRGGEGVYALTSDQRVWALNVKEGPPKLMASLRQAPVWLRFAADSTKLLVYQKSNQASLYDTTTGKILTSFASEWSDRSSLNRWIERVDPSGAAVAIRSPDNYVRVYRTDNGARTTELSWDDNTIADVEFSADAKRLLIVTEKGGFSNWDIAAGRPTPAPSLAREYSSYSAVTLKRTPDPSQMLAIDRKGYVDLYSLNTNSVRTFYPGEPEESVNAALSPDGAILAIVGKGDRLRFWHVGSREVLAEIPIASDYVNTGLQFSPDGRMLIVAGRDQTKVIRVPLVGDALLKAATDVVGRSPASSATSTSAQTPRLGVFMRDVSADTAKAHQLPSTGGAEVIEVFADSAAQAAGLRVGDIITKVDDKAVGTATEASSAVKDAHLDLSLSIVRGTAPITARAALRD